MINKLYIYSLYIIKLYFYIILICLLTIFILAKNINKIQFISKKRYILIIKIFII